MIPNAPTATVPVERTGRRSHVRRHLAGLYLELGKSRLSALVVVTAVVGFVVAAPRPLPLAGLLWVGLGTYLLALGANGLNQWLEADRDARMERTKGRPLPSGRMGANHAVVAALGMVAAGVLVTALGNNTLTAALGLANVAIYALVYTPLKPVTAASTLVGAVCGAIPPLMGWAAAQGRLAAGAWVLAGVLFAWQMPHSLALAYMYRDDYERGGYRLLPSVAGGRLTFHVVNLYCLALTPVALAALPLGLAGWVYGVGALALGGWMVALGVILWRRQRDGDARRLFLATLAYLPLLLGLMVADRGDAPRPDGPSASSAAVSSVAATPSPT